METTKAKETHSFTDEQGRLWTVRIHLAAVKELRDQLDLDLLSPTPQLMARLADDPLLLLGVLQVVLADDLETHDETPEGFARVMYGDTIDDATAAFMAALVNFSRRYQRPANQKMLELMDVEKDKVAAKLEKVLSDPKLEAYMDRQLQESLEKMEREIYGPSSTDSPESSASTPAD